MHQHAIFRRKLANALVHRQALRLRPPGVLHERKFLADSGARRLVPGNTHFLRCSVLAGRADRPPTTFLIAQSRNTLRRPFLGILRIRCCSLAGRAAIWAAALMLTSPVSIAWMSSGSPRSVTVLARS